MERAAAVKRGGGWAVTSLVVAGINALFAVVVVRQAFASGDPSFVATAVRAAFCLPFALMVVVALRGRPGWLRGCAIATNALIVLAALGVSIAAMVRSDLRGVGGVVAMGGALPLINLMFLVALLSRASKGVVRGHAPRGH